MEGIITLIVLGIVSYLFKSPTNQQKQQVDRKTTRTSPKVDQSFEPDVLESNTLRNQYESIKEGYQQSEGKVQALNPIQDKQVKQKKIETKKKRNAALSNNVVQGIIWSEIIGRPRSKKPYITSYRKEKI